MTGWRLLLGLVLVTHGVGHVLGVLAGTSLGGPTWNLRSRLLSGRIEASAGRVLGQFVFGVLTAAFLLAGAGVLEIVVPYDWWRPVAAVAAAVSLPALTVWWQAYPALVPNKLGSIGVDLVVVYGTVLTTWPTDQMLGVS